MILEQMIGNMHEAALAATGARPLAVYLSLLLATVFLAALATAVAYRLRVEQLRHRERMAAIAAFRDVRLHDATEARPRPLLALLRRGRE